MPHSQKFEAFKKKFVAETFPQTLTPLLKEMISMCIDSYFEILNFDGDSAFAFTNNFEWFREISEHDMRAIVYQLFDTGHSEQSIQQVVDCIKQIQLHPNILENYVPEDPRPLWVRFPDQHRPPFGRRAKIIHSEGTRGLSDDSAQAYTIEHKPFTIDVFSYRSGWKYKFVEENEKDEYTRTFTVHPVPHGIDLTFSQGSRTYTRKFTYELPAAAWDIVKAKIEAHSDVSEDGTRYTARAAPAETQDRPVYRFD